MTIIPQQIDLQDGVAENMGNGVFVLLQSSDRGPQNVVVTPECLNRLVSALGGWHSLGELMSVQR